MKFYQNLLDISYMTNLSRQWCLNQKHPNHESLSNLLQVDINCITYKSNDVDINCTTRYMRVMRVYLVHCITILLLVVQTVSYRRISYINYKITENKRNNVNNKLRLRDTSINEFEDLVKSLSGIAISGFINKENNFADPFPFQKLFDKGSWQEITAITDNLPFAKKRLVTPNTVYSGLIDAIKYNVANTNDEKSLQDALLGKDTWLAFNISSNSLKNYASIAKVSGIKRVVFAVNASSSELVDPMFSDVTKFLIENGIVYTIVKYSSVTSYAESTYPYRIVRGELPVPIEGKMLASQDLFRVLAEVVDISKTFNNVYGIGPGGKLDAEILAYMKAQGWPERVQVALLMGDLMERIENKYLEDIRSNSNKKPVPA